MPFPKDQILHGDCVEQMAQLPSGSVDVVFADPPYNLQLKKTLRRPDNSRVNGVNATWDRFADFAAYDKFSRAWLGEARRLLKPNGTLWVMGSYHNIFRLGTALQDLGYWILNDVIWRKANPMPHFRARRFTNAHETLIWAARSEDAKRYVFHYHALKAGNDDMQMRSDWFLPLCTGHERLKNTSGEKLHPTQKPEALLHRVLLASTRVGDVVLDPFFGTGTSGAAARRLRRHYVGIESNRAYVAAAKKRIAAVEPLADEDAAVTRSPADAPRIGFGRLLERGLIRPGARVFDKARRYQARVRADGSLAADGVEGSIHKVGAHLQKAPSCNGWTFWHVAPKYGRTEPVPLAELRERVRAQD